MTQVEHELMHYGVLGMKWGVRRSTPGGPLTPREQQRASKKYKRAAVKTNYDMALKEDYLRVTAYNKTAEEYNSKKTAEFNRTHDPKSKTYDDDLMQQFLKDSLDNRNRLRLEEMEKNKNYQKAQRLCEKYEMLKFDKLAQDNAAFIAEMKKALGYS